MLKKLNARPTKGPLTLIVMDGVGIGKENAGNAVFSARTPNLDMLMKNYPTLSLKAHGTAVGLPSDDDMGNSEVGHNAIGAGQVYAQGAKLVSSSIESGKTASRLDIVLRESWFSRPQQRGRFLHSG